jgi:aspartyl-tRNA(Asn)/glutamyl-tRNA(Gln) amidotransferase subunit B
MSQLRVIIGLETHVQLKTKTKIFCDCKVEFGEEPNKNTCPVCTGQPGVLPVLNKKALELGLRASLALNCKIAKECRFHRKNYFYPDLPKSYQISQYDEPLATEGFIQLDEEKRIRILRINLEEDAGKLIHLEDRTLVDLNRCGVPLLEIVTYPDINTPEQAYQYLSLLKSILQYIDVSDCDMEKGSLRVDANISVQIDEKIGERVEIKNMNSFKELQNALTYEIKRQISLLNQGKLPKQETRLWNEKEKKTQPMRRKEEASDYRYFPEPDLPPVVIPDEQIRKIKESLPELPQAKKLRFIKEYNLPLYDASVLVADKELASYYEACLKFYNDPKTVSNWVMTEVLSYTTEIPLKDLKLTPKYLAEVLQLIKEGKIHRNIAKEKILPKIIKTGKSPQQIIEEEKLSQIVDEELIKSIINQVLETNQKAVEEYKQGKEKALNFLLGQVMRQTQGKANPVLVSKLLKNLLSLC